MATTPDGTIAHTSIAGVPLKEAKQVLILLHGRGSSPEDMLGLTTRLPTANYAHVAIRAEGRSWYPYSFLAPRAQNEPWLSASLERIHSVVKSLEYLGFSPGQLYFLGFSQGACLMLEYLARHGTRYGGAVAFTGGLIGESIDTSRYGGDFQGMPVFIGTSDPDRHVPVERVRASETVLTTMGARVWMKVYPCMGHIVSEDEILLAGAHVLGSSSHDRASE